MNLELSHLCEGEPGFMMPITYYTPMNRIWTLIKQEATCHLGEVRAMQGLVQKKEMAFLKVLSCISVVPVVF